MWNEEETQTNHKPLDVNDQWVVSKTEPGRYGQGNIKENLSSDMVVERKKCFMWFKTKEWVNLTQMTIISTTMGKNPL